MNPSFAGFVIREYRADWALYFTASSDEAPENDWEINIQGAFTVSPRDPTGRPGESFVVEVEVPAEDASPFLATLPGRRFLELLVGDESELILVLENMTLTAPADQQYESWVVHGSQGEVLRCLPEGELGYTPPYPNERRPTDHRLEHPVDKTTSDRETLNP